MKQNKYSTETTIKKVGTNNYNIKTVTKKNGITVRRTNNTVRVK